MNTEPGKDILSAILAIDANAVCTVKNEDIDDIEWTSTPIAKADIQARKAEYPSIEEQLDKIYNDGIDAWKAVIKVTKDKYPKG